MSAYELADELDGRLDHKAANMLRQQADRIAELEKELSWWRTNFKLPTERNSSRPNWLYAPQTKPLSNDEILEMTIWNKNLYELYVEMEKEDMIAFARAIEERHGIK